MCESILCLHKYEMLNKNSMYKIIELTNILDTSPKNIVEHEKKHDCYINFILGYGFDACLLGLKHWTRKYEIATNKIKVTCEAQEYEA